MATLSSLSLIGQFVASGSGSNGVESKKYNHRFFRVEANKKSKKIRVVTLREDMQGIGTAGEQVKVKAGFFRNYLHPYGKAEIVSPQMLKEQELEKKRIEAEKLRVKEEAEQFAALLQSFGSFKVRRKPYQGNLIAGSVTPQDLADIIKSQTTKDIMIDGVTIPEIKELGEYIAEIKVHEQVSATVKLIVAPY